ncbi:MAG: flippase-like domain-containing protein [Synergistaceae bacterium]|nr:flippase-like domain-containing protein [Synergistaceae bacterium]
MKKGLSIFLLLSAAMSGALLYLTVDNSSLKFFAGANKLGLALSALLVAVMWLLDAAKLSALTRAAGESISYCLSLELVWLNYFGSAITPMQSGGGPFQMYLLYKNNVSVGKSFAITLIRTILSMLILGLSIPFSLLIQQDLPELGWLMRGFIVYVMLFIMAAWLGFVLSLFRPRIIKRWFGILIMILNRLGVLNRGRVRKIIKNASREIDSYNQILRGFLTTGRRYFLLAFAFALAHMIVYLSIMPCLIWSLGFQVEFFHCVIMQALFLFMLYFVPTPGGSGAAEGGAALVFGVFAPRSVAGVLGIGWRFLTEYTGILLGGLVIMKLIGWGLVNQIMTRNSPEEAGSSGDKAA